MNAILPKKRVNICNVPVDTLTMGQTVTMIDQSIQDGKPVHHVVINAAKVVNAQTDPELKKSIVNCDIINADGKSIVWAAKLLNRPVPERVAGIDLMERLVELAAARNYKIFFFGAKEDVVSKVVETYRARFGNGIVAGYRNGYYKKEEERDIAQQIAASGAHILFVAITSPYKEIFLNTYKDIIKVPFIMGVGGSFDVVSGKVKRAPVWMQNAGLEWLFRVIQEPKRMWKRYLVGNSKFIYLVIKEKVRQLFSFRAVQSPSQVRLSPKDLDTSI
ncbi:WecB/TagA/CpsF family glycosyltransferase [Flavisolibacter nicotianae]|uniref:WecB/TagA/CpsF family glycosyltransferase n=1 Tax=Flavisolibacter nicotianae TaxID=2364882 RepID=UPI000EADCAF2|nr:WecB/TagA/CpsF family glycosyltransferase [Flavisolibacter nicotianae]